MKVRLEIVALAAPTQRAEILCEGPSVFEMQFTITGDDVPRTLGHMLLMRHDHSGYTPYDNAWSGPISGLLARLFNVLNQAQVETPGQPAEVRWRLLEPATADFWPPLAPLPVGVKA